MHTIAEAGDHRRQPVLRSRSVELLPPRLGARSTRDRLARCRLARGMRASDPPVAASASRSWCARGSPTASSTDRPSGTFPNYAVIAYLIVGRRRARGQNTYERRGRTARRAAGARHRDRGPSSLAAADRVRTGGERRRPGLRGVGPRRTITDGLSPAAKSAIWARRRWSSGPPCAGTSVAASGARRRRCDRRNIRRSRSLPVTTSRSTASCTRSPWTARSGGAAEAAARRDAREFIDCMSVSAWSLLVALVRALLHAGVLCRDASMVAQLPRRRARDDPPYHIGSRKRRSSASCANSRQARPSHGTRVNAVRFSPWNKGGAGGAIPRPRDAVADAASRGHRSATPTRTRSRRRSCT